MAAACGGKVLSILLATIRREGFKMNLAEKFAWIRLSVRLYYIPMLALVWGVMLGQAVNAQETSLSFSGKLFPSNIDYLGLFGPAGTDLGNKPFTVVIRYKPSSFTNGYLYCYDYVSNSDGALEVNVTIDGKTVSRTSGSVPKQNYCSENGSFYPGQFGPADIQLDGAYITNTFGVYAGPYSGPDLNLNYEFYILPGTTQSLTNPGGPSSGAEISLYYFADGGASTSLLGYYPGTLSLVNPFLLGAKNLNNINLETLLPELQSPDSATALAADGASAAILLFRSDNGNPVTFTSNNGTSLALYDPAFLTYAPTPGSSSVVVTPTLKIGSVLYAVALLQAPPAGMVPDFSTPVTVTAKQDGGTLQTAYLPLVPPPVLLVHGIWGTIDSLDSLANYLTSRAPWRSNPSLVTRIEYPNDMAFDYGETTNMFDGFVEQELDAANSQGIVSSRIDVVAHSMGGLVARHYSARPEYISLQNRKLGAFHQIVTLNTPEQGSELANFLIRYNQHIINPPNRVAQEVINGLCPSPESNTAAACLANAGDTLGPINRTGGVYSLKPDSENISELPPAAIPNAIWNAVSSTVAQSYEYDVSALLFGLNYLIDSACSGPSTNYCPPNSSRPPPVIKQILNTPENDAVVSLASQTAGCVAPCQIAKFRLLAHTGADIPAIAEIILENRNVLNNKGVNETVACWLSQAGSSNCVPTTTVASRDDVAFSPDQVSYSGGAHTLTVSPPLSASLALPFDMQFGVSSGVISELTVEQIGKFNHQAKEKELPVSRDNSGNLHVTIVPELMGPVKYRIRVRFSDTTFVVKDVTVLVGPPANSPQSFHIASLEKSIYTTVGHSGFLHYRTHPQATFSSAPGQEIPMNGMVNYMLLPTDGLPAIELNKEGYYKALRVGKAVVEESFGGVKDTVVITVHPPVQR